jgi:uncharacterized membrane protein YfcA
MPTHDLSFVQLLYAFLISIIAGALNSIAGGGTLLTFPVLIYGCGLDEKIANATNTVGLVPAAMMGARGFSGGARSFPPAMIPFYVVSLVGGAVGAWLLNVTPDASFKALVPWLIVSAAVIFLSNDWIMKNIVGIKPGAAPMPVAADGHAHVEPRVGALIFQFVIAVYGGYFGAGIGIMMLAALSLMRAGDIYRINFLKNLAAAAINGVASVVFIVLRLVHWPIALAMAAGAILGGWGGAGIARKVGPRWARRMVSAVGFAIAAYMVYKQF